MIYENKAINEYGLTYFLFGGGQDSTYILLKIINDPIFRAKHVKGRLLVAMSNTGDEHLHTYEHIQFIKQLCEANGIEFMFIEATDGHHPSTWQSLMGQYKRNKSIGSAAFRQTCTDNLKVKPTDNFLDSWIRYNYGYQRLTRKKAIYQFVKDHGRIRLILGFAAGEEKRTSNGSKFDPIWKQKNVDRHYPLITDGVDRAGSIALNEKLLPHKVLPSNCKRCLYMSEQELVWLYRNEPKDFFEWVEVEKQKLEFYAEKGIANNYGVFGKITLLQKLEISLSKYGHWSNEQLDEYKYSHGHCIKTKY